MTLDLESFGDKYNKKNTNNAKYKAALGVGSVVSLFGIGSTLAANITLNDGGNVEFGQGVATTAACDSDGQMSIIPVTRYDNVNSIFRVTELQVTGIDLTPEGEGWDIANYVSRAAAIAAHPGQYYDEGDWKRTCDNVVLDFHAYTDLPEFAKYTTAGFFDQSTTDTTAPLMWSQRFDGNGNLDGAGNQSLNVPGAAAVIDVDDNNSDFDTNYGWDYGTENTWWSSWYDFSVSNVILDGTSSSFEFRFGNNNYQPNAAAISKITVQSMKYFPENYYADNAPGPGVSPNYNW